MLEGLPIWYSATLAVFHVLLAVPVVFIAVARMGRVFCYRHYRVEPRPNLEHSDGAGGLKPHGDYFLAQTYRMGLISGYLILITLFLLLSEDLEPRMLGLEHQRTSSEASAC